MSGHPRFGHTGTGQPVHLSTRHYLPSATAVQRFNNRLGLAITNGTGSMWTAYLFCLLSLCSLPSVLAGFSVFAHAFPAWMVKVSIIALVAWIAQTFFQLVLLPVIIVGQNLQNSAADARSAKVFEDTETIMADVKAIREAVGGLAGLDGKVADLAEAVQVVMAARAARPK